MFIRILILINLFVLSGSLFGQVNTEKFRSAKVDTSGWGFDAQLEYLLRRGNVELQEGEAEIVLRYAGVSAKNYLIVKGDVGWQGQQRFSNNMLLHTRHVRPFGKKWNGEFFAQIDYAKERLLDRRFIFGAGVSYNIFGTWRIAMALMHEEERYGLPATALHPRESSVNRLSSFVVWRPQFKPYLRGAFVVYYQPQLDDFNDIRVLAEGTLFVSLSDAVSLTIESNYRFDREPPDNIRDFDFSTKLGLAISL